MVEDGDPKHSMRCYAVNEFFEENEIQRVLDNTPCEQVYTEYQRQGKTQRMKKYRDMQLKYGSWPANSPELNLIERVWSWIEMKLNKQKPIYKKQDLKDRVLELWDEYPIEFLQKMCVSYEDKLWALAEAEGGQIEGRVSPHI